MSLLNKAIPKNISEDELNDVIIDAIQDIKGKNIVKLDMRKLHDAPTDFFIICEGDSTTQVSAIADSIQRRVKETFQALPNHVEGKSSAHWVLVDFFTVVVHVFYPETRLFYDLDGLWSDAQITHINNI